MQLVEVKGNIGKVRYSTEVHTLFPADFLLIDDSSQRIIAQINSIEITNEPNINVAIVRFVLSIDKDDNISLYRGIIPSRNSQVYYIIPDEIMELIKGSDKGIYFGELANHSSCYVKPSINILDKNLYIMSDREDKTYSIVENIAIEAKKEERKVVIIDFDGKYKNLEDASFLKVSDEIKLPLNIDAFNNIIEKDTSDCPLGDRALIQSIIIDVIDYLKSIDDKFISFSTFKNIIDDEFLENPSSGLMAFRNKLQLYLQNGIFAENADYGCVINNTLNNSHLVVVDLSKIKENWYNYAVKTIFDIIDENCYVILSLENLDVDRKYIAELYNKESVVPIISTSYDSKYSVQLKSICPNYIIGKPSNVVNSGEIYSEFLNGINQNQAILYGDSTLNLIIITELKTINEIIEDKLTQNEIKRDVDKLLSSSKTLIPQEKNSQTQPDGWSINDEQSENEVLDTDLDFLDEFLSDSEQNNEEDIVEDDGAEENILENEDNDSANKKEKKDELDFELEFQEYNDEKEEYEFFSTDEDLQDPSIVIDNNEAESILYLNDSVDNENLTLEEQVADEFSENSSNDDVLNEFQDENTSENKQKTEVINDSTDSAEQVNSEIKIEDNVENTNDDILNEFGNDTEKNEDTPKLENREEANIKNEQISYDEGASNNQNEEVNQEKIENDVEPPQVNENINTKKEKDIPIYDTKESYELGVEDLPFKTGDTVFHPKHGKGVVEGFTNYSNKILFCQINFENVGRRILDPRIAGIEKVEE